MEKDSKDLKLESKDLSLERQKFQMKRDGMKDIASAVKDTASAVSSLAKTLEPQEISDKMVFSVKGIKGDKGDKGEQGIIGIKGDKGDKGDSIKGDKGEQGITGNDGKQGIQGKDGLSGKDGINGNDGKEGKNGSPDTVDEIVGKLQGVKKQWLSIEAIDGDFNKKVKQVLMNGAASSLSQLTDVDYSGLAKDSNGNYILGSGGGGATAHSALTELDYASSGHTGFQPAGSYLIASDITGKVDKVTGKSLILDTEITRLAGVSNVDISGKQDNITLTTTGSSGAATLIGATLNIPQYAGGGMTYPGAGIALSTGSAWDTSITDNSANWNTAFGWGNHASGGYLTTASAASTYQPIGSYLTGTKVDSFNTRTGAVTLTSGDVTTALTFTPYNATNPSGYTSNVGTVTSVTSANSAATIATTTTTPVITIVSAPILTTARTISGTSFDGSANITLNNTGITNGAGYTTNVGTVTGTGTINELSYWTGASSQGTLAVATYPSLTEIAYVKGVTSAIQTQMNLKAPLASPTFTGTVVLPNSQALVTPVLGTPTSVTLTNATGLPIAGLVNSTSAALGLGTIELGHATDTTISRVSAGVIAVEGVNVLTTATGLPLAGGSLSGALNEAKGTDIASATTTDIGAGTGNMIDVTGTTTITGLGTVQAGTRRIVRFMGALILTHHATSLILPTGANITTVAGDTGTFVSLGSGNWVCTSYQRKDGSALLSGGNTVSFPVQDIPLTSGTTVVENSFMTSNADGTVLFIMQGVFTTFNIYRLEKDTLTNNYYVTHTTTLSVSPFPQSTGLAVIGSFLYVSAVVGENSAMRRYSSTDLSGVTSMTFSGGAKHGIMWTDTTDLFIQEPWGTNNFIKFTISGTTATNTGTTITFTSSGNVSGCISDGTNVWISATVSGVETIRKYAIAGGAVIATKSLILNRAVYLGASAIDSLPRLFNVSSSVVGIGFVFNLTSNTARIGVAVHLLAITKP